MSDTPPPPAPSAEGKAPWYKRRWVLITAGVFVLLMIFGDPEEDTEDVFADETATTAAPEATNETTEVTTPTTTEKVTTTTTTTTTTTAEPPTTAVPYANETVSQRNARRKAADYLDYSAFSRSGLVEQLEYEGFSTEEATYGVDALNVDWSEQAAKKAADYMEYSSFSRQSLIEQLEYEGFTHEQAEHGADSVGF